MDTMEGSNDEGIPYVNRTMGALVWVRRRNGSWWPGRILAPEELPGAHLLSPRTGTPVKLLGREDGSVDWYNIEKSRRVKAFRCGEFDECIEKARLLASALSKKREKYARREDAILHALELEKELGQQTHLQAKMFSMGFNHDQLFDFVNGGNLLHRDRSAIDFPRSLIGPGASIDVADASPDSLFSLGGHRKFLDVEWDDDYTYSLSHMRGLHDSDLGVDPLKEQAASWRSAYDHFPHAPGTEEKKKMASIVGSMAPSSVKGRKKKRLAPSKALEDESMHKKQKANPGPSNSNGDFGDGAFKLGSKFCFSPFTVNAGKHGSASLLQHKEGKILDHLDTVPFEYKPSKGWSGSEVWEASLIESRCRNELLSFWPFKDKAWLSFADHQKPSFCSGRPCLCAGSQVEVAASLAGSAFVDSLLQGGPASRCSVSPGAINEPCIEVERASSLSPSPPLSFQTWPSRNHADYIPEKVVHESGSRRLSASINPTDSPEYPFKTSMLHNASAMYSAQSNRLLDTMISDTRRAYDAEVPFVARSDLNANTITFSRHCLSPVAEEDAREGPFSREDAGEGPFSEEDEADSFQRIPGSSLSSPEAIVLCTTNGHLKEEPISEDESNCSKVNVDMALENGVLVEEGWDDESGICAATEVGSFPEECDGMACKPSFSKWQFKGRRKARIHCRMHLLAGVPDRILEENRNVHTAPNVVKAVGKRSRRPRRTFGLASCSEGEEELLATQLSREVGADHATKAKRCQRIKATSAYWFDVLIDFQHPALQPLVSIISELTGKHIEGYSVLVEKITNRSEEGLTYIEGTLMSRKSPACLPPAWRTARRTAMQRIPRSLNHHARKGVGKQRQGSFCNGQKRGMRKNEPGSGSSSVEKMHQKKPASLPQKTRMLSSIANQSRDKSLEPVCSKVPDAPLVTCVPVNVIFSRIREVLYRESNNAPSDCD